MAVSKASPVKKVVAKKATAAKKTAPKKATAVKKAAPKKSAPKKTASPKKVAAPKVVAAPAAAAPAPAPAVVKKAAAPKKAAAKKVDKDDTILICFVRILIRAYVAVTCQEGDCQEGQEVRPWEILLFIPLVFFNTPLPSPEGGAVRLGSRLSNYNKHRMIMFFSQTLHVV